MKIICVGRNYVKHILELNNIVLDEPAIFMKPESALINGNSISLPSFSSEIHHEIEIVYRISKSIKNFEVTDAHEYVDGITLGLDFTARDVQDKLKEKRLSWELSKAFDNSAFVGDFLPVDNSLNFNELSFNLKINSAVVQAGKSENMIFKIEKVLSFVSKYISLMPGDLVFTGTPEGVGRINPGDHLEAYLMSSKLIDLKINA